MRCPNCAGEIHDQSRFCGICGRGVEAAPGAPSAPEWDSRPAEPPSSMSLFELPVSARARALRLAVILLLDALLIGVGIALIISYVGARDRAGARGQADAVPTSSKVEILEPTALEPEAIDETPAAPRDPAAPSTRARKSPASSPSRSREPAAASTSARSESESSSTESSAEPAEEPAVEAAPLSEAEMEMLTRKVAGVVNSHQAQFERCSRQVAKGAGPVQGNVVIRFAISPDGRASEVRATTNTTGSDRLAACVVAQFESWTFPEHGLSKPLSFLWPLVFKAPQ